MPKISRKRTRDGQEASRSSTQASTGTVIPGDLSELSISELKNLCRELNFSSTGGRRVLVKRLGNERNRRTQSTSQASITTNNTTSVPTERESNSAPTKLLRSHRSYHSRYRRSSTVSKPPVA